MNGTGAAATRIAAELLEMIDAAAEPVMDLFYLGQKSLRIECPLRQVDQVRPVLCGAPAEAGRRRSVHARPVAGATTGRAKRG